jgi:hypothetical protein
MSARRCLALLLVAWLACCARLGPPEPAHSPASVARPHVCRTGSDGGPAEEVRSAERGIGGTGSPAEPAFADRGIGGTGIVGVITGFSSVCVDGLEIRLDPDVPVTLQGKVTSTASLRAGHLVVVRSRDLAGALHATNIAVRYEVSGPVERVEDDGRVMIVAGQRVVVAPSTWSGSDVRRGDWVSISGLRNPAGDIVASRVDRRSPGRITVHGQLATDGSALRIGSMVIPAGTRPDGGAGSLRAGVREPCRWSDVGG